MYLFKERLKILANHFMMFGLALGLLGIWVLIIYTVDKIFPLKDNHAFITEHSHIIFLILISILILYTVYKFIKWLIIDPLMSTYRKKENKEQVNGVKIDGCIFSNHEDLNHEQFLDDFLDWLEEKDCSFGGGTQPIKGERTAD